MRRACRPLLVVPALALAACAPAARAPAAGAPDPAAADAAQIRNLVDTFLAAWNAGNDAALARLLAEDATVIPPDGTATQGREAFRRAAAEYFRNFTATQTATTDEVSLHGDLAVATGTWRVREKPRAGGEEQVRAGRWLAVEKRQADGSWLPWRWIFNQADAAAAEPATAEAEIAQLLTAYAAAINSRNEARVRELYPSISAAGIRDLMRIGSTDIIKIVPAPGAVRVSGTGDALEILLSAEIVPQSQQGQARRMVYTVARGPRGWYIVSARAVQD
ncbi:MAG: SgcJ/EcaC family oxidoreductase [Gemmatimonadetes bacterium]|nr:SgcJ/EcaC family oxidoreductase [Gemmatimonadota bacterium]